jgi:protoporphyrinogen oxidase
MTAGAPSREAWCIVGGGMLGLALAHRLSAAGRDVTILEAAERLGGLASTWEIDGIEWDRHYHVILGSDAHLRDLLREIGLDRELVCRTTRTGFYVDGRMYPMDSALDYLRFPPLRLIDKVRMAATLMYASRIADGLPLEGVGIERWLVRLSGRRTFEQIWRPLLRAKLGENYRQASAAFIWAVVRRLFAARRNGMKTETFGYVRGGYARILRRLAEHLAARGVKIVTGAAVERIERGPRGLVVATAKGSFSCDRVVVTGPAPVAARICTGLPAGERQRYADILYQGIVCASVLLRRPLAGRYLTYITDGAIPFTAVVEMSALVDRAEFKEHTLVYLPKYVVQDDPAFAQSDAEIEASFLGALMRMYPDLERGDIVAFKISRVRHVLAVPTLDYSRRLPPVDTSMPGLHVVSSAHIVNGTLNVNETVALANEAAARLTGTTPAAAPARDLVGA